MILRLWPRIKKKAHATPYMMTLALGYEGLSVVVVIQLYMLRLVVHHYGRLTWGENPSPTNISGSQSVAVDGVTMQDPAEPGPAYYRVITARCKP